MARYRCTTSPPPPLAALAMLLLICSFHCAAAAARPLPAVVPLAVHSENGFKGAADGLVLQQGGAAGNGDELSISEMMAGAEEEACEEGKNGDDECMQRRLLRDAHLDYIYTQHKGKP